MSAVRTRSRQHASLDPWRESLETAGLTRTVGGRRYRAEEGSLVLQNGWGTFTAARSGRRGDPLAGSLGAPGLWRLTGRDDALVHRIFEIPPSLFTTATADSTSAGVPDPLAEFLRWAVATADGSVPAGWCPPARAQLDEWLGAEGMTVRAGSSLRQGTLIHEPGRLALVFPLAPAPPTDLGEARHAWLRELLIDAQNRWRLVRLGVTESGAVEAEVDLTGAPPSLVETLVRIGLDALRWVVRWLIRSTDFLADTSVTCRALEVHPQRV